MLPKPTSPSGPSVVLVEDEPATSDVVRAYLEREGFVTVVCANGGRALDVIRQTRPRCVVLDVMLPEKDGFEICQAVRAADQQLPILMLSARADELDRVLGLRLGADDYLVKPFSPRELVARVKALLRRSEVGPHPVRVLASGNLRLVLEHRNATVAGSPVSVTHFEFGLLEALLERPGQVLSRSQVIARVHGREDVDVFDRTVDVHVARIREKLSAAGADVAIETVRNVGYKIAAVVAT